jgi:uncharacterized repeat protein (TIGR02543 family)
MSIAKNRIISVLTAICVIFAMVVIPIDIKGITASASSVTITFNVNGGTALATADRTAVTETGGRLSALPVPTRSGWAFNGWFTAQSGGTLVAVNRTYSADTTLWAQWTQIRTITFNPGANGTVSPTTMQTGANGRLESLPTPTRTGSTFVGWFNTSAATGGTQLTLTTSHTANTTYWARWSTPAVVTFNAGSGTVTPSSATVNASNRLTSLPVPNRDGFMFDGWFTTSGGTVQVTLDRQYTANTIIYAQWSRIYTVTFNLQNAATPTISTAQTGAGGRLAELPVPVRTGFAFNGWFTAATGGNPISPSRVYTDNTEIFAQWSPVRTITLNAQGGTVNPNSAQTVANGRLTNLPIPTRPGFAFKGWFSAAGGGDEITTNTMFIENITIHAQWEAVTVTFIPNGSGAAVVPTSSIVGTNGRLPTLPVPSRPGHTFNGWFTSATGGAQITADVSFSESTEIFAQWSQIRTITFNQNFSGAPANSTAQTGVGGRLANLPNPTRVGITFIGWYTAATGGTRVDADRSYTSDTTLYARWGTAVTFNPNGAGATVSPASDAVNSDGQLEKLPTPTRANFAFNGWFTAASGGTEVTTDMYYDTNTEIFAQWSQIYTVTFNSAGGSAATTTATTGAFGKLTMTELPAATRDGFIFGGWFTAATGGTEITIDRQYTAPVTIHAQWLALTSVVTFSVGAGASISPSSVIIDTNTSISQFPTPIRTDFMFNGWFTAATGGDEITTETVFLGNTTIHAQWSQIRTVTFNPGGADATVTPTTMITGKFGKIASLPTPARPGFEFVGWFTAATGGIEVDLDRQYTANSTVYAQWAAITRTVTFNPGNGTVSPETMTVPAGASLTSLPVPVREGFVFDGWFTSISSNLQITAETLFANDTTAFARWSQIRTVTFDPGSGEIPPQYASFALTGAGGRLTLAELPVPVRDGYNFAGWFTAETGGSRVDTNRQYAVNTTIYARWTSGTARILGDVDGDGKITISDALEILMYLAGLDSEISTCDYAKNAARIKGGNDASICDALEILMFLAGMKSDLDIFWK